MIAAGLYLVAGILALGIALTIHQRRARSKDDPNYSLHNGQVWRQ